MDQNHQQCCMFPYMINSQRKNQEQSKLFLPSKFMVEFYQTLQQHSGSNCPCSGFTVFSVQENIWINSCYLGNKLKMSTKLALRHKPWLKLMISLQAFSGSAMTIHHKISRQLENKPLQKVYIASFIDHCTTC